MSRKLSKLLAYYEAERHRLVALVADCVTESEYKLAHHHTKALRLVNRKLQTFHNLADPLHDQKQSLLRHIEAINGMMDVKAPEIPRSFLLETLRQSQQQLEELNQAGGARPKPAKPSGLQDAMNKLSGRTIEKFTLVIDEANGIYCTVQLVRKTLIITFPQIQRLLAQYVLRKRQLRYLQQLGFRFYDRNDKLLLLLPYWAEPDKSVVRTILARILFEVFYFKQSESKAYIKYWENPGS